MFVTTFAEILFQLIISNEIETDDRRTGVRFYGLRSMDIQKTSFFDELALHKQNTGVERWT